MAPWTAISAAMQRRCCYPVVSLALLAWLQSLVEMFVLPQCKDSVVFQLSPWRCWLGHHGYLKCPLVLLCKDAVVHPFFLGAVSYGHPSYLICPLVLPCKDAVVAQLPPSATGLLTTATWYVC
jgi:hypothetical protein